MKKVLLALTVTWLSAAPDELDKQLEQLNQANKSIIGIIERDITACLKGSCRPLGIKLLTPPLLAAAGYSIKQIFIPTFTVRPGADGAGLALAAAGLALAYSCNQHRIASSQNMYDFFRIQLQQQEVARAEEAQQQLVKDIQAFIEEEQALATNHIGALTKLIARIRTTQQELDAAHQVEAAPESGHEPASSAQPVDSPHTVLMQHADGLLALIAEKR